MGKRSYEIPELADISNLKYGCPGKIVPSTLPMGGPVFHS